MEEKRGASQEIGDWKAAIRTKSSLRLNCQLFRLYIQVRTSMTNSPSNRLVRRLVSPSVSELVSVSDQSSYSKAISQPMSHLSHCMSNSTWVTWQSLESVQKTPRTSPLSVPEMELIILGQYYSERTFSCKLFYIALGFSVADEGSSDLHSPMIRCSTGCTC